METNNIETLESLLQTDNEHWNEFAYSVHCDVIAKDIFPDAVQPLHLLDKCTDMLAAHAESPFKGVELCLKEITEAGLSAPQQLFIYKWINEYLRISEFNGNQLTHAQELMLSHSNKLKVASEPVKPLVKDIRETLKSQIQKELDELPETLQKVKPEKRLNFICKLMPFVLPKVESIRADTDEA